MAVGAYKHSRRKVGKVHYKRRAVNIHVEIKREPVFVRGMIYGQKVKKEPAFHATACVGRGHGRRSFKTSRCASGQGHGPTAALRKALAKLSKTIR